MGALLSLLLGFKMYVKQYHWLARGYENHILADELEKELDDYIDEAAELHNINDDTQDGDQMLLATHILFSASNVVGDKYRGNDMNLTLDSLLQLAGSIIEECSLKPGAEGATEQAFGDYYGRLSNLMVRKCYLINLQRRK